MNDIRPYNEEEFRKKFVNSSLYTILKNDFDQLIWTSNVDDFSGKKIIVDDFSGGTPRQLWGDPNLMKTKFSVVPFYYLEFLTEKNPKNIYDLGCGWNIFKKYIPSIIGVGAEDPKSEWFFADIHDYIDDEYIRGHQNYFESVFSICALHFVPMSDLRKRVLDFASMIKPGGRGWVTFNAIRLLERDKKMIAHENLELWVRQQLSNLPFTILQFEVNLTKLDNGLDGNIRLILEK